MVKYVETANSCYDGKVAAADSCYDIKVEVLIAAVAVEA